MYTSAFSEGKLPWESDKYGNPYPLVEHDPLLGRNAHPDAAVDVRTRAHNVAIPSNAITPGLSKQQAAYIKSRPLIAESFYGSSVYTTAMPSPFIGDRDTHPHPRRNSSPSRSVSASRSASASRRRTGKYLGDDDDISQVRSRGDRSGRSKSPSSRSRQKSTSPGGSKRSPGGSRRDDKSLKGLSMASSMRGANQLAQGGNFTSADHVIAYKTLNKIPHDQQLNPKQTKEAIVGQFAFLVVKQKVMAKIAQIDDDEAKRREVYNRKVCI